MAHHFGRQAPRDCQLKVDYKKLAECFSLTEKDGTEHRPDFWELHPGSKVRSEEFNCTREDSVKLWEEHKERHGRLMPAAVHAERRGEHPFAYAVRFVDALLTSLPY